MTVEPNPAGAIAGPSPRPRRRAPRLEALSFRTISAVYIGLLLIAVFSIIVPSTFFTHGTLTSILNEQAISGLLAVALVIPLAAGGVDLSVGAILGIGAILVAWLIGEQQMAAAPAIAITLAAGAAIGAINGLLVTVLKLDSFISTLGMSSCLAAMVVWISNNQQILGLGEDFTRIATGELFGVTYPVYYMVVIAVIAWYVLEHTPAGRYLYATGGNPEAAKLAGLPTQRLIFGAFATCGLIAGLAGLLASARYGAGSPEIGPPYLLSAFAAAFLGSTQIKQGRVNVWGTLIAVYVLAIGVKGLQLAGAPFWLPDLFNGLALIVAVALARRERARPGRKRRGRRAVTAT